MTEINFTPPAVTLAVATIAAINTALERDQGASFRKHLGEAMPHAKDAYDPESKPFRTHLGASLIGRECPRELWYSFRWAKEMVHEGCLLRLFNRGHLEEPRFIALLKMIGVQVWQADEAGKQFKMKAGHHFGGSLDAVIKGIPEMPSTPVLAEFKTHGSKSFAALAGDWSSYLKGQTAFNGQAVRGAKFEHWVQMQIYMGGFALSHSLYLAVSKDTDEIYAEIVAFDPEAYAQFIERADKIINSQKPPQKISNSPGWYKCKFCDFKDICHTESVPARNCRTCANSSLSSDTWVCQKTSTPLDYAAQLAGCEAYERKI